MVKNSVHQYWNDFVSLIYPQTCAGCGSDRLDKDQLICWSCITRLPLTGFEKYADNLVADLFTGRIPVARSTGFLFFGKDSLVQHLIYRVKYKGNIQLGFALGTMMGNAIVEAGWWDSIDTIVPLPLNKRKQEKRGFNQAEILADGIGSAMNKPVETVAVVRSKFTDTQTRKSRGERWQNVADVFDLVNNHALDNKRVLLVDDVVTTGATLEACAQVLLKIPGLTLSIATLAFASKI
ncbi:MAG: phosphoribosyltransferase family protein [Chitinophagaceae bacterium]